MTESFVQKGHNPVGQRFCVPQGVNPAPHLNEGIQSGRARRNRCLSRQLREFEESLLDGLGNGLGYGIILIAVASIREVLGFGSWLSFKVLIRNKHWPNQKGF